MQIIVPVFRDVVAVTAPNDVGADNSIVGAQFAGQIVEITCVACQPVHTKQGFKVFELADIAPFEIVEAVEPMESKPQMIVL